VRIKVDDADAHYNPGNALVKQGNPANEMTRRNLKGIESWIQLYFLPPP
jgi:hypothetical protein